MKWWSYSVEGLLSKRPTPSNFRDNCCLVRYDYLAADPNWLPLTKISKRALKFSTMERSVSKFHHNMLHYGSLWSKHT